MDFEILKSFIMPHNTVTVDAYTPPDHYNVYANAFDLSLLPTDGDALSQRTDNDQLNSAQTQHNATESTAATDADISLDDYIPTTVFQHFTVKSEHHSTSSPSFYSTNNEAQPDRSPAGSDQYFSVFPPSPAPSNDSAHTVGAIAVAATASNATIKQEYCSTLYPPSPPDSYCSLSPRCASDYVKGEHAGSPSPVDASEACLDIESLLDAVAPDFAQHDQHQQDHQLLREFLQDTTFQRRHNLKPLALDALLMGGWDNGDDIGPVISLALEHARKDVQRTCEVLQISPDPQHWSIEQVQSWLLSTMSQFGLSVVEDLRVLFPEDGAALSRLSDEDFVKRLSQNGRTLHAQLEVWKAACNDSIAGNTAATCYSVMDMMDTMDNGGIAGDAGCNQGALSAMPWSPAEQSASAPDECSDDEDDEMSLPALAGISSVVAATDSTPAGATDATTVTACTPGKATVAKTGGRQGGAHIHLWQFLKELLADAQQHGTAIRWLDRAKGVFKIEDSVRVARLWGRRKNRPAMNYDKLSRSIRQYYKKGIMKKTERSQRLVYQFCHPYCL